VKLDLEAIALRAHEEWITSTRGADLPREGVNPKAQARPKPRIPPETVARWRELRAQGHSDKRIARDEGVAQSTVSKHLTGVPRVAPTLRQDPKSVRSREWWRRSRERKRAVMEANR